MDDFTNDAIAELNRKGIPAWGTGAGACGDTSGDYDAWNVSILMGDWSKADAAVRVIDERLQAWGMGHFVGLTVGGQLCPGTYYCND